MPNASPLRLSDSELDAVFAAARPIEPGKRDAFLQAVAGALNGTELGPGALYRVLRDVQRRFYDVPDLYARQARSIADAFSWPWWWWPGPVCDKRNDSSGLALALLAPVRADRLLDAVPHLGEDVSEIHGDRLRGNDVLIHRLRVTRRDVLAVPPGSARWAGMPRIIGNPPVAAPAGEQEENVSHVVVGCHLVLLSWLAQH
jgi:hypothetical protein